MSPSPPKWCGEDFGLTHEHFAAEAAKAPPGSGGLLLLPYLEGERTPNVPDGTGVWFGANKATFNAAAFCPRRDGRRDAGNELRLAALAPVGRQAAAKSAPPAAGPNPSSGGRSWPISSTREVVTLKVSEGAAYGAALQALWCWRLQRGERVAIDEITDQFVQLNRAETAEPIAGPIPRFTANCRRFRTGPPWPCAAFSPSTAVSSTGRQCPNCCSVGPVARNRRKEHRERGRTVASSIPHPLRRNGASSCHHKKKSRISAKILPRISDARG